MPLVLYSDSLHNEQQISHPHTLWDMKITEVDVKALRLMWYASLIKLESLGVEISIF